MSTIVVGVDGSDDAQRALDWAIDEAEVRQWSITVVSVVRAPIAVGPGEAVKLSPGADQVRAAEQTAKAAVDKALAAADKSVPVSVIIRTGAPAEELVAEAAGADLLVVGSRGTGGFARLLLGSVSSQIVHHATCPTVIVPTRPRN